MSWLTKFLAGTSVTVVLYFLRTFIADVSTLEERFRPAFLKVGDVDPSGSAAVGCAR